MKSSMQPSTEEYLSYKEQLRLRFLCKAIKSCTGIYVGMPIRFPIVEDESGEEVGRPFRKVLERSKELGYVEKLQHGSSPFERFYKLTDLGVAYLKMTEAAWRQEWQTD